MLHCIVNPHFWLRGSSLQRSLADPWLQICLIECWVPEKYCKPGFLVLKSNLSLCTTPKNSDKLLEPMSTSVFAGLAAASISQCNISDFAFSPHPTPPPIPWHCIWQSTVFRSAIQLNWFCGSYCPALHVPCVSSWKLQVYCYCKTFLLDSHFENTSLPSKR